MKNSCSEIEVLPTVAVLLATYNGVSFISEQVSSLLWQNDVNVHIFIRDDGSKDCTVRKVESFLCMYPETFTIVRDGKGSQGSATANFFLLMASINFGRFDYVALADQDDIWMPDKLARAIECLRQNDSVGYSSNLLAFEASFNRFWLVNKAQPQRDWDYLFQGASGGCTYVLSARTFELVVSKITKLSVPLCSNASHDWIIYAICRSNGLSWYHDKIPKIFYRQHGGNVYGAQGGFEGLLKRLEMSRTGWYREHIIWLRNVLELNPFEQKLITKVAELNLRGRFWLLFRVGSFRRRFRDRLLLGLSIIFNQF